METKKFDKEPVAWITRNGKHIPIFDDNDENGEDLELNPDADEDNLKDAEGNYGFFQDEADKWLRDSDYEAKQNAYDYVTRDFPELGEAMRREQFGENYPKIANLYRVGGTREGIISFFADKSSAERYAKRFDIDEVQFVKVRTENIIPTFSGAGEVWATDGDIL